MTRFHGAKIALLFEDKLVLYLRDDRPDLRWANLWDFPGGGRENDETPEECVLREVEEEFGIRLEAETIFYRREYPSFIDPSYQSYFMAARITEAQLAAIKFGDEGQRWEMVGIAEALTRADIVSPLQDRFRDFWESLS